MGNVNFNSIFAKKHHYLRNLVLVLIAVIVIAGIWYYPGWQTSSSGIGQQTTTTIPITLLSDEERECLDVLAEYDTGISTMSFKDYVANKHIDFSNGTNIEWKVAHSGEDANRFFIDSIPMYQNIVFLVSSNEFEGCGKTESKKDVFVADEHYSCRAPFEYFISSSKGDSSSLLRTSMIIINGSSSVRIFYIKNKYYNNIYENLMNEVNRYGCQKV